jgi:hypothetical protein
MPDPARLTDEEIECALRCFSPERMIAKSFPMNCDLVLRALAELKRLREENADIGKRFAELAAEWRAQCPHHSSKIRDYICQPAYLSIIALGWPVVPYILRDMERQQDFWFSALTAITGANPVTPDIAGRLPAMTKAWLEWGKANGYGSLLEQHANREGGSEHGRSRRYS